MIESDFEAGAIGRIYFAWLLDFICLHERQPDGVVPGLVEIQKSSGLNFWGNLTIGMTKAYLQLN